MTAFTANNNQHCRQDRNGDAGILIQADCEDCPGNRLHGQTYFRIETQTIVGKAQHKQHAGRNEQRQIESVGHDQSDVEARKHRHTTERHGRLSMDLQIGIIGPILIAQRWAESSDNQPNDNGDDEGNCYADHTRTIDVSPGCTSSVPASTKPIR